MLAQFPSDRLFPERAALLGRAGRPREALAIYVGGEGGRGDLLLSLIVSRSSNSSSNEHFPIKKCVRVKTLV